MKKSMKKLVSVALAATMVLGWLEETDGAFRQENPVGW